MAIKDLVHKTLVKEAKKYGSKAGKWLGDKITGKKPKEQKQKNPVRAERQKIAREEGALSNSARRMGKAGYGTPKTLTAEQREQRADQMRKAQQSRW